jgi:hypothetical protein
MGLKCIGEKCKNCPNHVELLDHIDNEDLAIDGCLGLKPFYINFEKSPLETIQEKFSRGEKTDFYFKLMPPIFRSI